MTITREECLERLQRGEALERVRLAGIDLSNASLENAVFDGADLRGANLGGAMLKGAVLRNVDLREAYLVGADLTQANLEGADLEGAKVKDAVLAGANLSRANLEAAEMEGCDLAQARLAFAELQGVNLGGADLRGAVLAHANLEKAYLGGVCLENADTRFAVFTGATVEDVEFTGAKVLGLIGTGQPVRKVRASWVDVSPDGDESERAENGHFGALLSGTPTVVVPQVNRGETRYIGIGDRLAKAELSFAAHSRVEIEGLLEDCDIRLGDQCELVIAENGVLADCSIRGGGSITIKGKFYQKKSPGIVQPSELVVMAGGMLDSDVVGGESTRFAFERGCHLQMKILRGEKQ
jgi:uncharacterized protein YjbI with pentapeptide repeats